MNAMCLGCMQGKVKLVADAVWSKLTGVFMNDALHVQVSLVCCILPVLFAITLAAIS